MILQDNFDYQVTSLVNMVQRWHRTGGTDRVMEARIRTFVAAELLGGGLPDVSARALGVLEAAQADRLHDMINHCWQTFYRKDGVWRAFAVPVAVNWHMRHHRLYIANRGDKECLDALASAIRQCGDAKAVFLDTHMYSAMTLFKVNARHLRDHLHALVAGAPRRTEALTPMALRSSSEPPWRMAYFLGVEVLGHGAPPSLNEPGVQEALQPYLHLGADALKMPNPAMFKQGARGDTLCQAPRYLQDAIHFGHRALRGYRLRQMLAEISKEEDRVTLHYSFDPLRYAVDVLLSGVWLAFEMCWTLSPGETMDDFLREVDVAISAGTGKIQCALVCLACEEFRATRAATAVDGYRKMKT
jgi:hypothetical protein